MGLTLNRQERYSQKHRSINYLVVEAILEYLKREENRG